MRRVSRTEQLAVRKVREHPIRRILLPGLGGLILLAFGFFSTVMSYTIVSAFQADPLRALVAALAAVGLGLPYLFAVLWLDRNEPEPAHILAASFVWGAVMATGVSLVANHEFGAFALQLTGDPALADHLTNSVSAPIIEECSKGMAILLIYTYFTAEFDSVLDGLVYGAMVGLGFAVAENFIYYVVEARTWPDMLALVLVRGVITGAGTHIIFSGLVGLGLGMFRVLRAGRLRWLGPPAFLALGVFVHFAWNTFYPSFVVIGDGTGVFDRIVLPLASLPVAVFVLQLPFLLAVLLVAVRANRHEDDLIRNFLYSESPRTVRPAEIAYLVPHRRRVARTTRLLASGNIRMWQARRSRDRLLVRLAFAKWHMNREDHMHTEKAIFHAKEVQRLRRALQEESPPSRDA